MHIELYDENTPCWFEEMYNTNKKQYNIKMSGGHIETIEIFDS